MRKLGAGLAVRKPKASGVVRRKEGLGGLGLICSGFSFPPSLLIIPMPFLLPPHSPFANCMILLIEVLIPRKRDTGGRGLDGVRGGIGKPPSEEGRPAQI